MASNIVKKIYPKTGPLCASRAIQRLILPLPINVMFRNTLSTTSSLQEFYLKRSYLKRWGRRDMKRRQSLSEHELERTNLRMIKKADFLPFGVKSKAADDIQKLPRDSCPTRVRNRCTLTDRPRGLVGRYRISRMEFRDFGEKALIAGVQKCCW